MVCPECGHSEESMPFADEDALSAIGVCECPECGHQDLADAFED